MGAWRSSAPKCLGNSSPSAVAPRIVSRALRGSPTARRTCPRIVSTRAIAASRSRSAGMSRRGIDANLALLPIVNDKNTRLIAPLWQSPFIIRGLGRHGKDIVYHFPQFHGPLQGARFGAGRLGKE